MSYFTIIHFRNTLLNTFSSSEDLEIPTIGTLSCAEFKKDHPNAPHAVGQYLVRVVMDPERMAAYSISTQDIRNVLQLSNAAQPSGTLTASKSSVGLDLPLNRSPSLNFWTLRSPNDTPLLPDTS